MIKADVISIWGIREPLSAISHFSGALLALVGLFVLLRRATARGLSTGARTGLIAYGGSMICAFTASTLFHYFPGSPEELRFFKKLDHAAIFLVIAGTCTVLLNAGRTERRRLLIATSWTICLAALILKMLVWPMELWLSAAVYLTVGWISAVSVLSALRHVNWEKLRLLVYGLVVLTLAAVVFATETPVLWAGVLEGHELFHVMVLIGTGLHFFFVLRYCTAPEALRRPSKKAARSGGAVSLVGDPQGN